MEDGFLSLFDDTEKSEVSEVGPFFDYGETTEIKRSICVDCMRPSRVCLCSYYPASPYITLTAVIILQHPNEESRRMA